mmetsp:Transcript_9397/g.22707  ORF Transcript_9397/g.22707 Transcript_9397/m.22707 type:complete len:219 (+) Transcript_9397:829-1485(+)
MMAVRCRMIPAIGHAFHIGITVKPPYERILQPKDVDIGKQDGAAHESKIDQNFKFEARCCMIILTTTTSLQLPLVVRLPSQAEVLCSARVQCHDERVGDFRTLDSRYIEIKHRVRPVLPDRCEHLSVYCDLTQSLTQGLQPVIARIRTGEGHVTWKYPIQRTWLRHSPCLHPWCLYCGRGHLAGNDAAIGEHFPFRLEGARVQDIPLTECRRAPFRGW